MSDGLGTCFILGVLLGVILGIWLGAYITTCSWREDNKQEKPK